MAMASIHWAGNSGDWATTADWTGGVVPGAGDDVFFDGTNTFTATINAAEAARSITIGDPGATVQDNSTLTIGATLTVSAGFFALASAGVVDGGTLNATSGGAFAWNGGTLSGVIYTGALDLSASNAGLNIAGSLVVKGPGGTGNGTINDTGHDSHLYFENTQTFDNATINLGGDLNYVSGLQEYDTTGAGGTLTLGSKLIVNQTASQARIMSTNSAGDTVLNMGTINAVLAGDAFNIDPVSFTNQGTITVANGDTLYISQTTLDNIDQTTFSNAATGIITVASGSALIIGSFTNTTWSNTGTITIASGSTLTTSGTWSNAGTITATGATIVLGRFWTSNTGSIAISGSTIDLFSNLATSQLALFNNRNDTITIGDGCTLTNIGDTLSVGPGSALDAVSLDFGGMITGGTIADAGSGIIFNDGTLSGVTYDGAMDLSGGSLFIVGGLIVNGPGGTGNGTINDSSRLGFGDTETIDNVTINLENGGVLEENPNTGMADTLTLGPGVTVNQTGQVAEIVAGGAALVNIGTINAAASGGLFQVIGGFTNQGTIIVSNGDTLDISAGTFSNSGSITVGGTATLNDAGTVVQTGAVTIGDASTSGAELNIAKGAIWELAGNVGLARGQATTTAMKVGGTLIKTAGTGKSKVGLRVKDSGLIEVALGTLDFIRAIGGKGTLKIDAGATLEVDTTTAPTLIATFSGATATLALKAPTKFAATIGGFAVGDTIDLLRIAATAASINASDQLVIVNGMTAVASLQLAGNYSGATFSVGSDGNGGTDVTLMAAASAPPLSPAAPHALLAAMAVMGAWAGSAIVVPGHDEARRPTLLAPRVQTA